MGPSGASPAVRHAAAVARVRAVLDAHARDDISAAGALLEELELTAEATPPPIPDALTVATRFAQLAQTLAPQLPADVIGAVKANNGEWWIPPLTPQLVK